MMGQSKHKETQRDVWHPLSTGSGSRRRELRGQRSAALTMSECLLEGISPPLYPALRPPMAPLWEWDGVIIPCMSAWAPGIAVDGPTAWLRNTWMASSSRSSLSSIRLCCRTETHRQHDQTRVGTHRLIHVWQHLPCAFYFHFQISGNSESIAWIQL